MYNEAAWKSLDLLFKKIHDAGLVAAPIMLWTLMKTDPGQVYSEDQCIEIAKKQLERWDAPDVVWLLGGDGDYREPAIDARWKRIGRAVFAGKADTLSTLHPCGATWVGDSFSKEPWYGIATIQSGHGSIQSALKFLVDEEYAAAWKRMEKPFLNLEPNYEDARSYKVRVHLTDYHVRRASYWSLMVAPPAGITYGINGIWIWSNTQNEIAENHDATWVGQPWRTQLDTPGSRSMAVLRAVYEKLPWIDLRPAPERLVRQPGTSDYEFWQSASISLKKDCLIAYAPHGGTVALDTRDLAEGLRVYRVDPITGEWLQIGALKERTPSVLFDLPSEKEKDWLLVIV